MSAPGETGADDQAADPAQGSNRARATPKSIARLLRGWRYFVTTPRDGWIIVVLTTLAFVGTMLEAAAIGLIAPTALAIVSGDSRVEQEISFLRLDSSIGVLIGVIAALLVVSGLFQVGQSWLRAALISRVEVERVRIVIVAFLGSKYEYAARSAEGALQQIMEFVRQTVVGLSGLAGLLKSLTSFLVLVMLAVVVDVRAAAGIVVVVSVLSVFLYPFAVKLRAENKRLAEISMDQAQLIGEMRRTVREITVFGARDRYVDELDSVLESWRRHRRRAALLNNISQPLYQYVGMFAVVIGLYLLSVLDGEAATSASVSVLLLLRSISYGQNVQAHVQALFTQLPYAQMARKSSKALLAAEWSTGKAVITSPTAVEVNDVSYAYPDAGEEALRGVSLVIGLNETVGLVGPSGSGKSTLAQILLRLRIPQRGRLTLDGVWAEDVSPSDWFRHVSYVPQSPVIIGGSLRDNVTMYRPWIDDDQVLSALNDAGLADLLAQIGGALDAKLGPGARDLSGGQLQRLGIARALAGEPSWIILDEPTSALDLSTEAIVQESLANLKSRVGLVIIAHRLSTLAACDRLVVLADGAVQFDGPADDAFSTSPFLIEARRLGSLGSEISIERG